jgi:hypothetical protein
MEDQSDWEKWLPFAIFVFNTTPHTSTRFTPHELLFRQKPNIPGKLHKDISEIQYAYDNYVKELQPRL